LSTRRPRSIHPLRWSLLFLLMLRFSRFRVSRFHRHSSIFRLFPMCQRGSPSTPLSLISKGRCIVWTFRTSFKIRSASCTLNLFFFIVIYPRSKVSFREVFFFSSLDIFSLRLYVPARAWDRFSPVFSELVLLN